MGALRTSSTNSPSAARMRRRASSDGAPLRVAAAYTTDGGHPPAGLVSLVGHAIRLHGFFNSSLTSYDAWSPLHLNSAEVCNSINTHRLLMAIVVPFVSPSTS